MTPLGIIRMAQAAERSMALLDLVRFFPGAPVSALRDMMGQSQNSIRDYVRYLRMAGLVKVHREVSIGEKSLMVIYPAGAA